MGYCNWTGWQALDQGAIAPTDRGFTLGDGVFETLLVLNGQICLLPYHLERLREDLQILSIDLGLDDLGLTGLLQEAVERNRLTTGILRLTVSRGPGQRGLIPDAGVQPTLVITPSLGQPIFSPVRLVLAQNTRRNEFSPLSRIKSLNYLDNLLARQGAIAQGADDALLLNTTGYLTESSVANFCVRLNGQWFTPPVEAGVLPGVIRRRLLEQGDVQVQPLLPSELDQADAMLLCNSLGLRSILTWEEHPLAQVLSIATCRDWFFRLNKASLPLTGQMS
jgi:branched-chain amino acid aminotransferase